MCISQVKTPSWSMGVTLQVKKWVIKPPTASMTSKREGQPSNHALNSSKDDQM
jgi:hypothetical protein